MDCLSPERLLLQSMADWIDMQAHRRVRPKAASRQKPYAAVHRHRTRPGAGRSIFGLAVADAGQSVQPTSGKPLVTAHNRLF